MCVCTVLVRCWHSCMAWRHLCAPDGMGPTPCVQVYDLLAKLAATVLIPFAIGKVRL